MSTMARTRSTRTAGNGATTGTAAETTAATPSTQPRTTLGQQVANATMPFILPRNLGHDARIFTIADPAYPSLQSRYLCCPSKSFYQFTKISAPTAMKSWLIEPSNDEDEDAIPSVEDGIVYREMGYVAKSSQLFIATPIDPLFLVLPALISNEKSQFLSKHDYFGRMNDESDHLERLIYCDSLKHVEYMILSRMGAVCDFQNVGDESYYRLSEEKLLRELWGKACAMAEKGLPPSMEEKFVTQPLIDPRIANKVVDEEELEQKAEASRLEALRPTADRTDSQTTTTTMSSLSASESSMSSISTAATSVAGTPTQEQPTPNETQPSESSATPEVRRLLRLRTAITFISTSYLPPTIRALVTKHLSTPTTSPKDFTPLDAHLETLAKARADLSGRQLQDNYSRKRGLDDDDAEEARAEKRRKAEEEKKRKASESRGVKNLKKVDVSGMKKMSDFFKKK